MFCRSCGASIGEAAQFCPSCGAKMERSNDKPLASSMQNGTIDPAVAVSSEGGIGLHETAAKLVEKIAVAVAAVIMAALAFTWVARLLETLEGAVRVFGFMEGFAPAVGTILFVVFGVAPALLAIAAVIPIVRGLVENGYNKNNIERSIVSSVLFVALGIAYYIGKIALGGSITGDFGKIASTLALSFGQTAVDTLVPMIVAVVILIIVRAKMTQKR